MSRFLILSEGGDGVGLALRLKTEGHDARIWIRDPEAEQRGKGLVDCACEYQFGQTVVADCTGLGALLDKYREGDAKAFGGSSFADKLETDRDFAEEVMHRAEIDTPESVDCRTWDDAAKAVEELVTKGEKVVIKPSGTLSGVVPSYVASDAEDAVAMLEHFRRKHSGECNFSIQEFVEGIAVSTEGWFDGESWVDGMFNHTLERKHFLNGDLGPSGGCVGNVVWHCDSDDPLVRETLTKLTDLLREHRYVGPIDVNCVVNEEGVYALEFTPRFGYDAFPTLLHGLLEGSLGELIESCCSESTPRRYTVSLHDGFAAGIRLSLPPWPSENFHSDAGIPIRGFSEQDLRSFYPYEVSADESGILVSSGGYGTLGVMNGVGDTVGEAFARAYGACSRAKILNVQYRTDLGEVFVREFRELKQLLSGRKPGWVGVDLDGTLARYTRYRDEIGEPIVPMVNRVKKWIDQGKEVRVLTARVEPRDIQHEQTIRIHEWIKEHIGTPLEVTDRKDHEMIELYDDRVTQVEENTGVLV